MATVEQISEARKLLESRWDAQGACRSCGYHAALYEHDVLDEQIEDAIDNENGVLELGCFSDDSDGHRGVRVDLKPAAQRPEGA
jgi:hypothetical protein